MIRNIIALFLCMTLCSCAGGGFMTQQGTVGYINGTKCQGDNIHTIVKGDGSFIECVSEETMIAYYKTQSIVTNRENRYKAIESTKGDAAAQVLLAYESMKDDAVVLERSKKWDERLLPYWQTGIQLFTGNWGSLLGGSRDSLRVEGNGNEIHIGDTKFGRDGVQTDYDYNYKYDYILNNTQIKSPASANGSSTVDNNEEGTWQ